MEEFKHAKGYSHKDIAAIYFLGARPGGKSHIFPHWRVFSV